MARLGIIQHSMGESSEIKTVTLLVCLPIGL